MILILPLLRCWQPHLPYYCCYYLHYLVKGSYIVYLPFRFRFLAHGRHASHPLRKTMLSQNCLRIIRTISVDAWHRHTHHRSPYARPGHRRVWVDFGKRDSSVYIAFIVPHYLLLNMWCWPLKCTNLFVLAFDVCDCICWRTACTQITI